MKYDFKTSIDRKDTGSKKWNLMFDQNPQIGKDAVPMSVADMEFLPAPEIIEGLKEFLDQSILGYSEAYDSFYQAVLSWMKEKHNWEIEKEWIINTAGVVPALNLAIKLLTEEGDGVITFSPVYGPFNVACESNHRVNVSIPLLENGESFKIDFDAFEEAASKPENKLLLFCSPHNPVGRVWTEEELRKVIEIANKYKLYICIDEIWHDIILDGYKHTVLATLDSDIQSRLITCTAPSKTFNIAGLMISNIIISDENLRKQFINIAEQHYCLAHNAVSFKACELAYSQGQGWLEELLQIIERNQNIVRDYIQEHLPQIKTYTMEGTFVQWIDCRALDDTEEALNNFLVHQAEFIINPGTMFGETGRGFIRINLALPTQSLERNLQKLTEALNNH